MKQGPLIQEIANQVYLQGTEALSGEHFDAFFSIARGLDALKAKHKDEDIGLEMALMQEDLLELLGIGLDKDYLAKKNKLRAELYSIDKASLPPEKWQERVDQCNAKIATLRLKPIVIDQQIHEKLQEFSKPENYKRLKQSYSLTDFSPSLLETDPTFKYQAKLPNESQQEFEAKQELHKKHQMYLEMAKVSKAEADAFFDKEVIPLMRAVKMWQANKRFAAMSVKMDSFVRGHQQELASLDANTMSFVFLMNNFVTDLQISGMVEHVGLKVARNIVRDLMEGEGKGKDLSKEEDLSWLKQKAAQMCGEKIKETILSYFSVSKDAFLQHLAHIEKTSTLQIPTLVSEQHQDTPTSFSSYLPKTVEARKPKEKIPSFFDFIEHFNKNKGEVGTVKAAYKELKAVYNILSSDPDPHLAFEEEPTPGSLFAKALEEEAANFNYKILIEYYELMQALFKENKLPEVFRGYIEEIDDLQTKKRELDVAYKKLIELHAKASEEYQTAKIPADKLEKEMVALTLKREENEAELLEVAKSDAKAAGNMKDKELLNFKDDTDKLILPLKEKANKDIADLKNKQYEKAHPGKKIKAKDVEKFFKNNKALQEEVKKIENALQKKINKIQNERGERLNSLLGAGNLDQSYQSEKFKKLTEKNNQLTAEIKETRSNLEKEKEKLGKISIAYHEKVDAFKQAKSALYTESQDILESIHGKVDVYKKAKLELEAKPTSKEKQAAFNKVKNTYEPHLFALYEIVNISVTSVANFRDSASLILMTEGFAAPMTYEEVAQKVVEKRDVKGVASPATEKSKMEKIQDNLLQIGAQSIIEGVSGRALQTAELYVSKVPATLGAESQFEARQAEIDREAEEQRQRMKSVEPVKTAPAVVSTKLKPSGAKGFFSYIGDLFRRFKEFVFGKKEQEQEKDERLDATAAEAVVNGTLWHSNRSPTYSPSYSGQKGKQLKKPPSVERPPATKPSIN